MRITGEKKRQIKSGPEVVMISADHPHSNRENPFEHMTSLERWAIRAAIIGRAIEREWQDLIACGVEDNMEDKLYVTSKEASERLSISERSFHRWVRRAGVTQRRIMGSVRYKWSEIEQALADGNVARESVGTTTPAPLPPPRP